MQKLYSTIMLLAMMVAALGLTACGGDDEDEIDGGEGGGSSSSSKTLVIDGKSYYCGSLCHLSQTDGNGMYLTVTAVEDIRFQTSGHELVIVISPSKVSQLSVGQVFDYDEMRVRTFRHLNEIVIDSYNWKGVDGNIVIKYIGEKEITIQINSLVVKSKNTGVERTISGTATLYNSLHDSKGNVLPF